MVRTVLPLHLLPACLLAVVMAAGCSDSVDYGERWNSPPETELTSGPVESDTTTFRVHFYWTGSDKDGEVVRFRFAVDADTVQAISAWQATTATDTILTFPVDPITAVRAHVFMVAAEDNDGLLDPTPARRFFASSTIPPTSCIVRGPGPHTIVPTTFTFEWTGFDPDGGPDGAGTPVQNFEYILLQPTTSLDGSHPPLPTYHPSTYADLLGAGGDSLPAPYGDWKWVPIGTTSQRFQNVAAGEYVFAVRATDEAGAREQDIEEPCNIRHFHASGTSLPSQPILTVCTSMASYCVTSQRATDIEREPLESLAGVSISASWSASAESYGGIIVGCSYAVDDTSALATLDPARTGVTLPPDLQPGLHFLFVRAVDDGGAITNVVLPFLLIEPAFRDPAHGRQVLYVDDSTAPGVLSPSDDAVLGIGNFPNDVEETEWWTFSVLTHLGVPVTEWDALLAGWTDLQGRKPPPLRTLANYSTVIWNVDFQNSPSNPTALGRTLFGSGEAALRGYLAAGGTLILTGFDVSSSTVYPNTILDGLTQGLCDSFEPGTLNYAYTYFPRLLMGIDRAVVSKSGLRRDGARDFISAYATSAGLGLGFDSLRVDRGPPGSEAKWITSWPGDPEVSSSPGLPRVDGWILSASFGCVVNPAFFRVEDPSQPIAEPILRYHGVNKGVNEDGGPSPREDLVVGIRVQAHDEGQYASPIYGGEGGPPIAEDAYGRMVHFSFPFYFLRDDDAIDAMRVAFEYVNASPTLP